MEKITGVMQYCGAGAAWSRHFKVEPELIFLLVGTKKKFSEPIFEKTAPAEFFDKQKEGKSCS